jgi:hypothetical protein
MACSSITWKKSDKAAHRATVEGFVSHSEQMLSPRLSEEHYMFLLASKPQAKVWSADGLHFAPGEPQFKVVEL